MAVITNSSSISLDDIQKQAEKCAEMIEEMRGGALSPKVTKTAPVFSSEHITKLCSLSRSGLQHRLASHPDLPQGTLTPTGRKRLFTLAETQAWARTFRKDRLRPKGAEAITISIANFKGGTTKTTTSMSLAQGLTLLGHKVLVIDTDPQASLTTLFGILPDMDVLDSETLFGLFAGDIHSVEPLIRSTYWDGLDLVQSASSLYGAEYILPARQQRDQSFNFFQVLNLGLQDAREIYDVIIIDTPPSLSYVTINALMASNGIIMPLPPYLLDFASAGQFWQLFSDLSENIVRMADAAKEFDFIKILLTKVEARRSQDLASKWINVTYADKLLPMEIPKTEAVSQKSMAFGTIYDSVEGEGRERTYKRARDAFDTFVEHVEDIVIDCWQKQMSAGETQQPTVNKEAL